MHRWARRLTCGHHTPASRPFLSLFLRCAALNMVGAFKGLLVWLTNGTIVFCWHLLQGLCGLVSLHIIRVEELRDGGK